MKGSYASFAEAVSLLMKQPRTAKDLAEALGVRRETAYRFLATLKGEGLIYVWRYQRVRGQVAATFAWQPTVCHHADAVRPE